MRRYRDEPVDEQGTPIEWDASARLGAAKLAANLYTNRNAPGISENSLGQSTDQAYRRATDVLIEQLLRIGRFAPPSVG